MKNGFTLIELIIVIIVVAILSATVAPQFISSTNKTHAANANRLLGALKSSVNILKSSCHARQLHNATLDSTGDGSANFQFDGDCNIVGIGEPAIAIDGSTNTCFLLIQAMLQEIDLSDGGGPYSHTPAPTETCVAGGLSSQWCSRQAQDICQLVYQPTISTGPRFAINLTPPINESAIRVFRTPEASWSGWVEIFNSF